MSSKYLAPLWSLAPKFVKDESTNEYKWTEQRSVSEPSASQNTIKINLDDTNSYMLFSDAVIELNMEVTATDAISEEAGVCIPNAWNCFDEVRLMMNNKLIQTMPTPGILHHMLMTQKVSKDYANSVAEKEIFYPIGKKDFEGLEPIYGVNGGAKLTDAQILAQNPVLLNAGQTAIANAAGDKYFLPLNDHRAPTQQEFEVQGDDTHDLTGRTRRNPEYDPYYDAGTSRIVENGGKLSCWLPVREIFPLLEHAFRRVQRGSRFELQFQKASNMGSVFRAAVDVPGLTFTFGKVSLWIPRLNPSLESTASIESQIATMSVLSEPYEKHEILQHTFNSGVGVAENRLRLTTQSSRPTRLFVGFQKVVQRTDTKRNPVQFEGLDLEYMQARINMEPFPVESYKTDDKRGLIRMLSDIHSIHGKDGDFENGSVVDYSSFANGAHRVYVFDLTQMDNTPFKKANTVAVEIRYRLKNEVGEDYTVWSCIVSEGMLESNLLNGKILITQS